MYEKTYNGYMDVLNDIMDGKFKIFREHEEENMEPEKSYYWMIYCLPGCDELYLSGYGGQLTAFGGKVRVHENLCDGETIKERWRLASIGLMFGPYAVAAVKEFYGMGV